MMSTRATTVGVERNTSTAERVEVSFNGAAGDAKLCGKPRRTRGRGCPTVDGLGNGVEPFKSLHLATSHDAKNKIKNSRNI